MLQCTHRILEKDIHSVVNIGILGLELSFEGPEGLHSKQGLNLKVGNHLLEQAWSLGQCRLIAGHQMFGPDSAICCPSAPKEDADTFHACPIHSELGVRVNKKIIDAGAER
jgi:hypothetical protein